MGTPEFAVQSLQAIVNAAYHVVGVVTAPDKPAGRGRKLQESAVKKYAVTKQLKIFQPTNLKDEAFLYELRSLNPNLQVVVAFRMLPKVIWNLPEYGTFNLHASLLPQYRGAAPINWAIINGETSTGVSTFFIDEKIDTGKMILQQAVSIETSDNAGSLHDKLMKTGAELVLDTLELIKKNSVTATPQTETSTLKEASKLNKKNTKIDWNWPLDKIYNFIRGLNPYPTAWTPFTNDEKEMILKLYSVQKKRGPHRFEKGEVIQTGKEVKIAVQGGFIVLEEVQLPGKRKMNIKDLLNGYKFHPGAKVL